MKEIPLSGKNGKGRVALVDDDVFDYLDQQKWYSSNGYAKRGALAKEGKRGDISMHREIMNAPKGVEVDHINGNPLDNRRENLRLCTRGENMRNTKKSTRNTSGYKGVSWHKKTKQFRARIVISGKTIYLGYYKTAEEAGKAYDRAAKKRHKEFARPNFDSSVDISAIIKDIPPIPMKEIIEKYRTGRTMQQLSKEYGIPRITLVRRFKYHEVPIRSYSEAQLLSNTFKSVEQRKEQAMAAQDARRKQKSI